MDGRQGVDDRKNADYARQAADQGAQVMCFQELFYGPYFCQVQENEHFDYAEPIPDGPTTKLMQTSLARPRCRSSSRSSRRKTTGSSTTRPPSSTPTAPTWASTARPHIPHVNGFWEKFYFRPGNLGYPSSTRAVGRIGVYICYDRHFPEGWRALGLGGAKIVFNPSATSRGLSMYLWNLEQPASAVANEYFIGAINRVGTGALRRQRLLRIVVLR